MGKQAGIGKVRQKCMIQLVLLHGLTQANNKKSFLLLDCGKYSPLDFFFQLENDI